MWRHVWHRLRNKPALTATEPAGVPAAAPDSPRLELLHVLVVASFAVSQPAFSLMQARPAVLADQGRTALILVALLVGLVLPGLFALVEFAAGRLARAARPRVHLGIVFVLLTLLFLPVVRRLNFVPGVLLLSSGVVLGGVGTWLYRRHAEVRQIVTIASPGLVLFPVLFLAGAPVWEDVPNPAEGVKVKNPVPVVMIIFDEFCGTSLMNKSFEIDAVRYPHFAELTRQGTWYRNATSVHPATTNAVPAIMSGIYPRANTAPLAAEHPYNLFTLVQASERYKLVAFEPYTRLYPMDIENDALRREHVLKHVGELLSSLSIVYLHHLCPKNLDDSLPEVPRIWFGLRVTRDVDRGKKRGLFRYNWDAGRDEQFQHFLECIGPSEKPPFYFAHVALPHVPWCYLPSGHKYRLDAGATWERRAMGGYGLREEEWDDDPFAVEQSYQRYLLQLGYVDHLVGQLIEQLKSAGLFDECLLILTADHGVSFRAGQSRRWVTETNFPDILAVPLFVKTPHQKTGGVSDRNVESIDILPTIADVLGMNLPEPVDGVSLLDTSRPERPQKKFYNEGTLIETKPDLRPRLETARRMMAEFGSETKSGLYAIGPHPELLGRPLDELAVQGRSPVRLELAPPRTHVTLEAARKLLIPCYFEGYVSPDAGTPWPIELAIALNGTVQGVTRTYLPEDIKHCWTAMVPESALEPGENKVQFFVITTYAGKVALQECTPAGQPPLVCPADE